MVFNSLDFMVFFPIVVLVFYIIPARAKNIWLLGASYYFYMCWNAKYALLILTSTVVTYISGLLIEKIKHSSRGDQRNQFLKKCVVAGCFLINLGILFYFKYINFVFDLLSQLFSFFSIQLHVPVVDVLLPVGISFYTFQALSYTVDVYRDDIYAEKNFVRYALFVSFFPQLVAGPIERSKNLLKQIGSYKPFSFEAGFNGFLLMLWGLFLKIILADRIAIFVDTVYGNHEQYPGYFLTVATVLFAVQIYCDFAGYSTIAIGAAKIMGITLMENFQAPYLSLSVGQFWRNWHISLTSWFKDYLYIPLGGSRKGKGRKYLNKIIVFLVSGLWHGAELSFVFWGGLNGLYQVLGEALQPLRDAFITRFHLNRKSFGHRMMQMALTFFLVDFAWIFFRAASLADAMAIIRSIGLNHNPWILSDGSLFSCGLDSQNFSLMLIGIGVLLFVDICKKMGIVLRERILRQDFWFRCLFVALAIMVLLIFGIWGPTFDDASFIYFQF